MQTVSQSWKKAHEQTLLNEGYVEISLDIADPEAMGDAFSTDNGAVYISDTSEVVSEIDTPTKPYGTLEQNIWILNGTRISIPNSSYADGGYVGDALSNAEGVFDTKVPVVTIQFTKVHTNIIPGLTISWGTAYNEYPEHFIVTVYNGDIVVAEKEILDNKSMTSVVTLDISNYDRITIQILNWCLPNHRARMDEIFVGWHKIYSKNELLSYSHKQSVNPITTSLPKMEVKFSIDNSDGSYNPYNISGLTKYLLERQEVKTRYGLKLNNTIEWIDGGVFYLSEWYAKQNGISADFVARDLLEFMSAHYKDVTFGNTERSLYDLATQVLGAAGLSLSKDGTVKWVIDDSLKSIYTKAPLPDDTIANCLQMIANMGCCTLYPDRKGILHISPINNDSTDYEISRFNSYVKSELTITKSIRQVVVKVYQYSINDKGGIDSTITEVATNVGDVGEVIVVDNPLVTDNERASILGVWIGNYLKNRMTLKSTWRADVRLDAFDIVKNENDYNSNNVRMTDVEFKFNGAFRGTGEGRVI